MTTRLAERVHQLPIAVLDIRLGSGLRDDDDAFAARSRAAPGVVFLDHARRRRRRCKHLYCRVATAGGVAAIPHTELKLLSAICARRGGYIASSEIVDSMRGDDEDGEPDTKGAYLSQVYHIRRRVAPLGLSIACYGSAGWCVARGGRDVE